MCVHLKNERSFNNERFATVRPRLVAGLFIRKGSSLPFVDGLGCVCAKYSVCVHAGVSQHTTLVYIVCMCVSPRICTSVVFCPFVLFVSTEM